MFKRKGGGVKGLLNNVQKNCTFLAGWLPLLDLCLHKVRLIQRVQLYIHVPRRLQFTWLQADVDKKKRKLDPY